VGLEFAELDIQQQMDLVQCTLARADAWLDWSENREIDRPLNGLKEILYHSMRGFQHLGHYLSVRVAGSFHRDPEKVDLGIFPQKKTGLDAINGRLGRLLRAGRGLLLRPDIKMAAEHGDVARTDAHDSGAGTKGAISKKLAGLVGAGRDLLLKPGMLLRGRAPK
jgi:hypothetical protein